MSGISYSKHEQLSHLQKQSGLSHSVITNIPSSQNQRIQNQTPTMHPSWYTDGRLESSNQNATMIQSQQNQSSSGVHQIGGKFKLLV
jgi:hypothetical protein